MTGRRETPAGCASGSTPKVPASRRLADLDGLLFVNPEGRDGWWPETSLRRTWSGECDEGTLKLDRVSRRTRDVLDLVDDARRSLGG